MKLKLNGVTYYYEWLNGYQKTRPTLLCLHGFTGTSTTFSSLAQALSTYNVLGVDLIGHGQTSSAVHPLRYSMKLLIADLVTLSHTLKLRKIALLGYSMGGRVALGLALASPKLVSDLILISSSPGLETIAERLTRQVADTRLARNLLNQPLEKFVNSWEGLPLFASQKSLPQKVQERIRLERLSQNKLGLALSLLNMGTGKQTSYWDELPKLAHLPTLLITGEEDVKFCGIAKEMQKRQPTFEHLTIPQAGHTVYLEQAHSFNQQVGNWLKGELKDENQKN